MNNYLHIVNVEGIIHKDDHFLTVVRSKKEAHAGGTLSFIGGKVDFIDRQHNILEETLKREILEEVGIRVDNLRYITSTGFTSDDGYRVINIVMLCDWQSGDPYAVDPDEVESVEWMTADQIRSHLKTPPWILEYTNRVEEFIANER